MIHLVLGGARSGKSRFAEQQVKLLTLETSPYYLATATPFDDEMSARIRKHQQDRKQDNWQLIECPLALAKALHNLPNDAVVLVDCLTLWLNNVLHQAVTQASAKLPDTQPVIASSINASVEELIAALKQHQSRLTIILVANEVGLGVVPMGEQSRLFVDHAGWLNQHIAALADEVTFVAAGLPLSMKKQGR